MKFEAVSTPTHQGDTAKSFNANLIKFCTSDSLKCSLLILGTPPSLLIYVGMTTFVAYFLLFGEANVQFTKGLYILFFYLLFILFSMLTP